MKRINFILILLLLIGSCGQYENANNVSKRRAKRDLKQQIKEVKKTPEEALKEKLSEDEKINLEFLKEALGDESKLNQLLSLDESKVKETLKHINDELAKCTGNNASEQKETFKQVVKAAGDLDNIKQATSTCDAVGS
ncbi:Mlp family lipoprotein (plasmid) [Borrelia miyamotoi]|uniref:Mlp family lipoprotein n=2 Tax=Borrelia miyamotoi TaxID=47466 RepID=A0AAQ3CPA8_9SPIR|nr:Mlp family lipoprotein [Borrelia miyamotoi]AHH05862.1 Mlp lipoprotein family protein [Borrelia miyamotoi FR64b]ATQ15566.1 Mlp family lipoprotein [Borrelia miyamotoi]ATQ16587.1 Mlp family lipoprotein [Borrelia miyamotoi]ATQ17760.1 Mlp family lipoprotein [Borrelia miyamotoi]ATQ18980.1 Mlp family lipoprotein [Borrelia miyamotoi]